MLVRVIAVAFLGAGAVSILLYFLDCSVHHTPFSPLWAAVRGWPALIGIAGLIKGKALAGLLSDWLDM